MIGAHFHPDAANGGHADVGGNGGGDEPSRLHLLLSYAGWEPDPLIERLPRLLEPMGVVSHRAGTGKDASRLIQNRTIHIAVVDLGLPLEAPATAEADPEFSEGGPRLLELLRRLDDPPPVVAVKRRARTSRDDAREIAAALRLGAFAVVDRPRAVSDLDVMLGVLRRCLDRHYRGRWPG